MKSVSGSTEWKLGVWNTHRGKLILCKSGFHACKDPYDILFNILDTNLALIEVGGKIIYSENKFVAEKMRVIKCTNLFDVVGNFFLKYAKFKLKQLDIRGKTYNLFKEAVKSCGTYIKDPSDENYRRAEASFEEIYTSSNTERIIYTALSGVMSCVSGREMIETGYEEDFTIWSKNPREFKLQKEMWRRAVKESL